jgi:hypothetical protein
MERDIFEVVKEYEFSFDELDHSVKGKVLEQIAGIFNPETRFSWKLSHYGRSEQQGSPYIPTRQSENTFEGAEASMFRHVEAFGTFDVQANGFY